NDSIGWICEELGLNPERAYSGGDRGWVGDNPFIYLDISKIRSTGWEPQYHIKEGVIKTVQWLKNNPWVF
ncbi:MAG: nucleoside-diphosphate sugar epimerase, partial [Bdellovibrio sp.]